MLACPAARSTWSAVNLRGNGSDGGHRGDAGGVRKPQVHLRASVKLATTGRRDTEKQHTALQVVQEPTSCHPSCALGAEGARVLAERGLGRSRDAEVEDLDVAGKRSNRY